MISREFFHRSPVECAQALIGCVLRHGETSGIVVEAEAYDSQDDPACHTFFRPSARAFVAAHPAGSAYVYMNYGVHWLFNVLVKGERCGFVLVRALEPLTGLDVMAARRNSTDPMAWCSGPGKLSQALGIGREHHGMDVCSGGSVTLEAGAREREIVADGRIGISVAREFPWRFTVRNSPYISRRPKP